MTEQDRYQLQGTAAQTYEAQKVPSMFRPLAEATLAQVEVRAGDRVLDVACGTGIMARLASAKVGPSGRVVGVDLNASMIEVARAVATNSNLEWREGDATALPFDDGNFDLVFCQQGLQFFPDKPGALREMQRVLDTGGRAVLTVWSEASLLFAALGEALTRHISAELATRAVAPFAFRDGKVIEGLLADAGFRHIDMHAVTVVRRIGPITRSLPLEIAGSPIGAEFASSDMSAQGSVIADVEDALARFREDGGVAIPQQSHLIIAQ